MASKETQLMKTFQLYKDICNSGRKYAHLDGKTILFNFSFRKSLGIIYIFNTVCIFLSMCFKDFILCFGYFHIFKLHNYIDLKEGVFIRLVGNITYSNK